jgi:broad specificity phosphatase PhoE
VTEWIFVRHGESVANAEGWLSGWSEVALTPAGEAQAEAVGALLRETPFARCLVSDLRRAVRTAQIALAARGGPPVPLHVLPELRERHMGALQGEPFAAVRDDGRHARWLAPWDVGPPGGESHAVSVGRLRAALRLWDDGRPTLVVSHGSVLRGLLASLDGAEPASRAPTPNATALRWRGRL